MSVHESAEHSDDPYVVALYDLFHYISEEFYSAGWIIGLEEVVWGELRAMEDREPYNPRRRLDRLLLVAVGSLSEATGMWMEWSDEHGAVAVPLDEWKARHQ